eukprot:m.446589 g.446589  ORF g.446589 m.446589 type:complete len:134 (-) comp19394_c0_seq1:915-1316(-)
MWGAPLGAVEDPEWGEAASDADGWVDEDGALQVGRANSPADREEVDAAETLISDGHSRAPSEQESPQQSHNVIDAVASPWMRATSAKFSGMKVTHMERLAEVEIKNVNTRSIVKMGTLWADQPVVLCILRKLG